MPGNEYLTGELGIILLAGGASSRLGQPKQLLMLNGTSLLQHAIQVATGTMAEVIIVVLGANAAQLKEAVSETGTHVVINGEWQEGMGSSIRAGLQKLLEILPEAGTAIFMVCDQPFVTSTLLEELVEKHRVTGKPVVACYYDNSMGTPALFDKTTFNELMRLKGDAGAKRVMMENPDRVAVVNFPMGSIDIDTNEDYEAYIMSLDNPAKQG